jgi:hypothetical protein
MPSGDEPSWDSLEGRTQQERREGGIRERVVELVLQPKKHIDEKTMELSILSAQETMQ